jgi:hypothetical protein
MSHVLYDSRASYSSSIERCLWGSKSMLRIEVEIRDSVRGVVVAESCRWSTSLGDHPVGVVGVTSHNDGVVDQRPDASTLGGLGVRTMGYRYP